MHYIWAFIICINLWIIQIVLWLIYRAVCRQGFGNILMGGVFGGLGGAILKKAWETCNNDRLQKEPTATVSEASEAKEEPRSVVEPPSI